jgi:signal transduction histidine kinase
MEGSPRPLPSGISLAAFRIVQESLTNVTRHAGVDRATVIVDYGDQVLTVQIDDEGGGLPARPAAASTGRVSGEGVGSGSGIAGMAERTIALGGELEAGPRPVRGFRVRARFPLPEGT